MNRYFILILLMATFATPAIAETVTSPRCNEFTFDGTGSHDPDSEKINYSWDFGDGQSSTEPVVSHTYKKAGDYEVTLTITDNSGLECSSAVQYKRVKAIIPPVASFDAPSLICTDQEVEFDASASNTSNNKIKYTWDFGDGTSSNSAKKAIKTYTKGGTYDVELKIDDLTGSQCGQKSVKKEIIVNEPPLAEAGKDIVLKCIDANDGDLSVDFDATQSRDINKDQLTYTWDFGDGNSGTGPKVTHNFKKVGNYDVQLIVKDPTDLGCGTGVDFVTVRLNKAPKANAGEDLVACAGENLLFDGSNSFINKKGTAEVSWQFGDGTIGKGLKTYHTYKNPGQYQASLQIENKLNSMCPVSRDTRVVTVNATPSVSIKSEQSVCLGNKVEFNASSAADPDGDKLEYYWTFGDGTILRGGPKVSHEYKQGGTFDVSVIVDDGKGSRCSTATAATSVKVNSAPIADAGKNLSCCVDTTTEFNASGSSDPDGDELEYTWDLGDGTKAYGAVIDHKYRKYGKYNVTLTVNDKSGSSCNTSTDGFTANVNSSPISVINVR